jgi:hypothetical protein
MMGVMRFVLVVLLRFVRVMLTPAAFLSVA